MQEHGEYSVELFGNIIVSTLKGSFNEVGTMKYTELVKAKIATLANAPFAMLIDDIALEGGTPEAYKVLNDYNTWLLEQPLVAKALVINSTLQKAITLKLTPSLTKQNIEYFDDKASAMEWLEQQLSEV